MVLSLKYLSSGTDLLTLFGYFTSGDQLTGQISLQLDGDSKINSLSIKMKGKAEVQWTEHSGSTSVTYYDKQKYFSVTQFIIPEEQGQYNTGLILFIIVLYDASAER
uniref:Arrestin-like N-terminal domain-containing protein n=1 Tax=Cynoglossus semilaevis TaxID=244447 RepID=A0A3P8WKW5_CYNSE